MSGAGWRAIIQCPPRQPGGERPHEQRPVRQVQTTTALANVSRARRTTLRATVDALDRVETPNALSKSITTRSARRKTARTSGRAKQSSGDSAAEALRGDDRPGRPKTSKRHHPDAGNAGQAQRRWKIAEGNKAPREADRFGLSAPLHSSETRQFWRRRAQAIPTIVRAIATAYGRALEVALGAVVITGLEDTDGLSRRRSRSQLGWES